MGREAGGQCGFKERSLGQPSFVSVCKGQPSFDLNLSSLLGSDVG